ncbi:hypothetical protein Bca4012_005280 [Brassica carinata]
MVQHSALLWWWWQRDVMVMVHRLLWQWWSTLLHVLRRPSMLVNSHGLSGWPWTTEALLVKKKLGGGGGGIQDGIAWAVEPLSRVVVDGAEVAKMVAKIGRLVEVVVVVLDVGLGSELVAYRHWQTDAVYS